MLSPLERSMAKQLLVSHSLERWGSSSRLSDCSGHPLCLPQRTSALPEPTCVYLVRSPLPCCRHSCSVRRFRKALSLLFPFQSKLVRWILLSIILYTRKLGEMKDLLQGTIEGE